MMDEEYTTRDLVAKYVELRKLKQRVEADAEDKLKPIKEGMKLIENVLGEQLHKAGETSKKTEAGTVYLVKLVSIQVTDKQEFIDFAVENDKDMLDIRASKSGITTFMERHKDKKMVIPGIAISQIINVNIRKA